MIEGENIVTSSHPLWRGKGREQSLRYLISNFLPGHTMAIAYQSDVIDVALPLTNVS